MKGKAAVALNKRNQMTLIQILDSDSEEGKGEEYQTQSNPPQLGLDLDWEQNTSLLSME